MTDLLTCQSQRDGEDVKEADQCHLSHVIIYQRHLMVGAHTRSHMCVAVICFCAMRQCDEAIGLSHYSG